VWEAVHLIEGLLANESDIQPTTVHADTQGQSAPVVALATLFGFDLMPRIRNFRDLTFFRANGHLMYRHIDALFGERSAVPASELVGDPAPGDGRTVPSGLLVCQ
jgi:TnpA family transposase